MKKGIFIGKTQKDIKSYAFFLKKVKESHSDTMLTCIRFRITRLKISTGNYIQKLLILMQKN